MPGESTRIDVTTPTPSTRFGQGGGTRIAETPIGLSTQDLEFPSRTDTDFRMLRANPVGLLMKSSTSVGIFVS